ncbi:interleukin 12Ba precursor [Genypterus blacodes]|uniref:interleukin 12Ba precursor n=1 Tax=Genypterus blacodes TaxID=154954 RepID=UPI003F75D877
MIVFCLIFAFLPHVGAQNPLSHWTLMPNVLVLEVNGARGHHPLTCLESPGEVLSREDRGQGIVWRQNGEEMTQRGNSYPVELQESSGGGNYTCHNRDGSLLNHTVVLIQHLNKNRILLKSDKEYLKCFAHNYNGEFHCSWKWDPIREGTVAFVRAQRVSDKDTWYCVDAGAQRWMCSSSRRNISCSVDGSGHCLSCVDEQHCAYAEETQPIHVTVYVKTGLYLLESYSKYFYLSEIVKPDTVRISKVNKTMIEWSYPSSWSSPHSYFPLTFQIAQNDCRRSENPCTDCKGAKTELIHSTGTCLFEIKRKVKIVCIRAKDAFCDSQWGEWSLYRPRGNGKKENKRQRQHERMRQNKWHPQ